MFENLKKLFITEVKDLIGKIESALLELEKTPEDENLASDIFRYLHTIKGAAGMYGFNYTAKLAHLLEDVYKKIKNKELPVNQRLIDLSLKSIDIFNNLIDSEEALADDQEIENLKNELSSITDINEPVNEEKEQKEEKTIKTYYILFEPNADIYERGVRLSGIIEDLENLDKKIITPYTDDSREEKGELPLFWEIIVVSDNKKLLDSIFIFVPDEVKITPICDCDALAQNDFVEFYSKLVEEGYSQDNLDKIKSFFTKGNEEKVLGDTQSQTESKTEQTLVDQKFEGIESVRVESKQLDNLLNLVSELIIGNARLNEVIHSGDITLITEITEKLQTITNELKEQTLRLRLVPIKILFDSFRRIVREIANTQGKKIRFITEGGDTLIDKTIIEKLYTPLLHIIRNAIDHGIETPQERIEAGKEEEGYVRLIAFQTNVNIFIQIQDDGRGLDPDKIKAKAIELGLVKPGQILSSDEIYELIFMPEFSTASQVSLLSGRGMGMDIIRKSIRDLRGNVEIESEKGLGTSVTLKLPSTISIIETLWVSTNNVNFLIPLSNIITTEKINPYEIKTISGNFIPFRGELIPLINARDFFDLGGNQSKNEKLIVINLGTRKYAIIFEQIHNEVSAVVKNLGKLLQGLDYFIGASILGDGSVAYIIDPYKILKDLNFVLKT